jgi:hypothetical protein
MPNSMTKRIPTDDEKLRAVSLLYNRLTRGFSLYFWLTRIHPMLAEHPRFNEEKIAAITIRNSCVESVLLSVRDLDDFFRPRTKWDRDSDVRVSDFGSYSSPGPFLSEAERNSINQWVAHLTYQPVWTGTTGIAPDPEQNWNTAELVGKATRAVICFLSHLELELRLTRASEADGLRKVRTMFERELQNMETIAALEAESFSQGAKGT